MVWSREPIHNAASVWLYAAMPDAASDGLYDGLFVLGTFGRQSRRRLIFGIIGNPGEGSIGTFGRLIPERAMPAIFGIGEGS